MDPMALLQNAQRQMNVFSLSELFAGLGVFLMGVGCVIAAVAYWRKNLPPGNYPLSAGYHTPAPSPVPPAPPEIDPAKKYGPRQ
jgi:hypothetical protein